MSTWVWLFFALIALVCYQLISISTTLKTMESSLGRIAFLLSDENQIGGKTERAISLLEGELASLNRSLYDIKESSEYMANHVRDVRNEEFRKSTAKNQDDQFWSEPIAMAAGVSGFASRTDRVQLAPTPARAACWWLRFPHPALARESGQQSGRCQALPTPSMSGGTDDRATIAAPAPAVATRQTP
jgi:hypothetical protein